MEGILTDKHTDTETYWERLIADQSLTPSILRFMNATQEFYNMYRKQEWVQRAEQRTWEDRSSDEEVRVLLGKLRGRRPAMQPQLYTEFGDVVDEHRETLGELQHGVETVPSAEKVGDLTQAIMLMHYLDYQHDDPTSAARSLINAMNSSKINVAKMTDENFQIHAALFARCKLVLKDEHPISTFMNLLDAEMAANIGEPRGHNQTFFRLPADIWAIISSRDEIPSELKEINGDPSVIGELHVAALQGNADRVRHFVDMLLGEPIDETRMHVFKGALPYIDCDTLIAGINGAGLGATTFVTWIVETINAPQTPTKFRHWGQPVGGELLIPPPEHSDFQAALRERLNSMDVDMRKQILHKLLLRWKKRDVRKGALQFLRGVNPDVTEDGVMSRAEMNADALVRRLAEDDVSTHLLADVHQFLIPAELRQDMNPAKCNLTRYCFKHDYPPLLRMIEPDVLERMVQEPSDETVAESFWKYKPVRVVWYFQWRIQNPPQELAAVHPQDLLMYYPSDRNRVLTEANDRLDDETSSLETFMLLTSLRKQITHTLPEEVRRDVTEASIQDKELAKQWVEGIQDLFSFWR